MYLDTSREEPVSAAARALPFPVVRNHPWPLLSPHYNRVLPSSGHQSLLMLESERTRQERKADLGGSRTLRLGHRERRDCSSRHTSKQLVTWCKRLPLPELQGSHSPGTTSEASQTVPASWVIPAVETGRARLGRGERQRGWVGS